MNDKIAEDLINDFLLKFISTKELAKKYNIKLSIIRDYLRKKFGDSFYKHSRIIQGKNNSISIKNKMQNIDYKNKWLKKVKEASKLGNKKTKELLETDKIFKRLWITNCKKGGDKTVQMQRGFHDPKNKLKRLIGSIKGLKKTTKKFTGPKGEHMYNLLEVNVANKILDFFPNYIYEKRFYTDKGNGYISCDFFLNINKPLIIEATYWDNVEEKCKRFKRKYAYLSKIFSDFFDFLIVVDTETMKEKYSHYIPNLKVISIKNLNDILLEIKNRGNLPQFD